MRIRRVLYCIMVILFIGSSIIMAATNEGKIVLRLAAYGSYRMSTFLEDSVLAFNELYPDIYVEIDVALVPLAAQSMVNTGFILGYEHRLLVEFAANDSPDVFFVPPSRGGLYRENGELIELSTLMNKLDDIYTVKVGNGNAGISSQTKHVYEASLLLEFLEKYSIDYSARSKQETLDRAAYDLVDISGLDGTVDDYIVTWNFIIMAKNCEDLIFFPDLFTEYDTGYSTSFRTTKGEHFLFANINSSDGGATIDVVRLAFKLSFVEDPYLANLLKEAVDTLIKVVDLDARINGSETVLKGLGANLDDFNFHFFNQMGYYVHNEIQYYTLGPVLSGSGQAEYQIVCRKSQLENKDYQRRSYPPNLQ